MSRKIQRTTAPDGTELELRERDDGNYDIVDLDSGSTVEEAPSMVGRDGAIERLNQTSRNIGRGAELERQRERGPTRSKRTTAGFGDGMSGGAFGGSIGDGLYDNGESTNADTTTDSGGLFGGGSGSGGLFGGLGGNSGGGGDSVRDPESGKFAPKRREPTDFEMERDEQGRFTGRADEDGGEDAGGFLGRFL